MRRKIILGISIIGFLVVTLFNGELMPLRREISDMEIIIIAGLDKVGDEYMVTFIKRKQSGNNSQGDGQDTGGSQVISMTAESYSVALRQLQTTTDKFTTASHIKYYIVGEETLRGDFEHVTDAIARGYQTRLNSKIYIAKGMTAKEFLEKASKLEFQVEEKLRNMENSFWEKGSSVDTDILDFGHISFSATGEGLVDTLAFYTTAHEEQKDNMESSVGGKEEQTNEAISFGYGGTAIISNCKIVGFLTKEETTIANYILSKNNVNVITARDKENFVVFRVENLNTKIGFEFNKKGIMTAINIDVDFKANYEETNATIPIFTTDMISYFEKELNKTVKEQINNIISMEKDMGVDFLYIREKLELAHPYKYDKNKFEFISNLRNCNININSKGVIQTTYDVVESNKDQKGALE